jgi:transposase
MNVVTGQLTTRLVESPAKAKRQTGLSKTARLQYAFAAHLHDLVRAYPASLGKPVIVTIDTAPWHQATGIAQVLAPHRHLQLYRVPSYSPQLNLIERFWRVLRRRATHKRLFESMRALRTALRATFVISTPCDTRCCP